MIQNIPRNDLPPEFTEEEKILLARVYGRILAWPEPNADDSNLNNTGREVNEENIEENNKSSIDNINKK